MMKTVMVMKWDGVTPDQYEELKRIVKWEEDPAKGGIFHVAAFSNNALRVTDIWESAEDFNTFVKDRLMPGVAQINVKSEPQVEMFPVHAISLPNAQGLS